MSDPPGIIIPGRLARNCAKEPERRAWLARLPATVRALERRWSLVLGRPFDGREGSAAWVAPVTLADGTPAVLKLGMPHMEAEQEIDGLRFWHGAPTVRLLDADEALNAMLLERCEPGTALRVLPEEEQDTVVAHLLRRLWRAPSVPHSFRPLSEMTAYWTRNLRPDSYPGRDSGLVREGIRLFRELPYSAPEEVLLATDLHAGNILAARREPWLVIDPKPFVGDPAYDATQHLFNCERRLYDEPEGLIRRFAGLLDLDAERIRLWTFARIVVDPGDVESEHDRFALARRLAP